MAAQVTLLTHDSKKNRLPGPDFNHRIRAVESGLISLRAEVNVRFTEMRSDIKDIRSVIDNIKDAAYLFTL